MSFHRNACGFMYVFAQKLNLSNTFILWGSCLPYLKVVSRLHKSFILGLWGVDLIFSLQGLNKKGREFASGIMSGGRYVRILRMGSVFKPTTLSSARVHICQEAQSLTDCRQYGGGEWHGPGQQTRGETLHYCLREGQWTNSSGVLNFSLPVKINVSLFQHWALHAAGCPLANRSTQLEMVFSQTPYFHLTSFSSFFIVFMFRLYTLSLQTDYRLSDCRIHGWFAFVLLI